MRTQCRFLATVRKELGAVIRTVTSFARSLYERSQLYIRLTLHSRHASARHLRLQVALVEVFDRAVVQMLALGHCLVRHVAAQLTDMMGEALGVARIPGQPVEPLYMHAATPRTMHTPTLDLQIDPKSGHRQVANPAGPLVVAATAAVPTR